ncbi:MAG: hypothetical protein MPW14_06270 [Candidatus Manganitrophus sp.]|nr:MAG: hypothetical protein MPW14_06270 [Candidatus Manganitrophus sp.]
MLLGVEHRLLGRLEHGIQPAQHGHRQDHVAVLAALEEVAQDVVGDAPDEGDDFVVGGLIQGGSGLEGNYPGVYFFLPKESTPEKLIKRAPANNGNPG